VKNEKQIVKNSLASLLLLLLLFPTIATFYHHLGEHDLNWFIFINFVL
jgi:hypothetical protein